VDGEAGLLGRGLVDDLLALGLQLEPFGRGQVLLLLLGRLRLEEDRLLGGGRRPEAPFAALLPEDVLDVRDLAQLVARQLLLDDHQVGHAEDARLAVAGGHGDAVAFPGRDVQHAGRAGAGVAQHAVGMGVQHRVGKQVAGDDVAADTHHAQAAARRMHRRSGRGEPPFDQRDRSRRIDPVGHADPAQHGPGLGTQGVALGGREHEARRLGPAVFWRVGPD
jgi:hypothetical protein